MQPLGRLGFEECCAKKIRCSQVVSFRRPFFLKCYQNPAYYISSMAWNIYPILFSPETGVLAETPFQVSCEDWRSNYIPLRYSIRYQSSFTQNTAVSSVDDGDKLWILWYHGPEQTSPSRTLPSGPKDNNFNLSLVVEIQDSYGAYTRFNLTVQVRNIFSACVTHWTLKRLERYLQTVFWSQHGGWHVGQFAGHPSLLRDKTRNLLRKTSSKFRDFWQFSFLS